MDGHRRRRRVVLVGCRDGQFDRILRVGERDGPVGVRLELAGVGATADTSNTAAISIAPVRVAFMPVEATGYTSLNRDRAEAGFEGFQPD